MRAYFSFNKTLLHCTRTFSIVSFPFFDSVIKRYNDNDYDYLKRESKVLELSRFARRDKNFVAFVEILKKISIAKCIVQLLLVSTIIGCCSLKVKPTILDDRVVKGDHNWALFEQ